MESTLIQGDLGPRVAGVPGEQAGLRVKGTGVGHGRGQKLGLRNAGVKPHYPGQSFVIPPCRMGLTAVPLPASWDCGDVT